MTEIIEGDLKIKFPTGTKARKFDNEKEHGLSYCMKAVDFIVELTDRLLYIEFKDPDSAKKEAGKRAFAKKLHSGELDNDLKYKYRDSYLYELASNRTNKPIYYYVLIAMEELDTADLLARTDALKRQLPIHAAHNKAWERPFVAGCAVFNLTSWNKFIPLYPVTRLIS